MPPTQKSDTCLLGSFTISPKHHTPAGSSVCCWSIIYSHTHPHSVTSPHLFPHRLSASLYDLNLHCPSHPDDPPGPLPTDWTTLDLLGTSLASTDMPTGIEQTIHLLFIAYLTQLHLLICNLELHSPLPMSLAAFPAPSIHVAALEILHLTLTVWCIGGPVA